MSNLTAATLTKEMLTQEYLVDKLNKREIARRHDVTLATVMAHMKKHDIENQPVWVFRGRDLTGKTFGRLTAIERMPVDKHHKSRWKCRCACGGTVTLNASSLVRQLTSSCGCLRSEINRTGYKEISGSWWRRLTGSANQRGYEFDLTPEYIWSLYEEQNKACALTGLPISFCADSNQVRNMTVSVDRIDSTKGYVRGNVQLLHKVVNMSKSWLNEGEYVAICNLVSEKRRMSHEDSVNRVITKVASKARY